MGVILAQTSTRQVAIGKGAYDLILHHEVSSRSFYDAVYQYPCVPGEDSGVTIGIGYDLGQVDVLTFNRDWGSVLSREDMVALTKCIGLERSRARAILPSVKHVTIPWDKAEYVFQTFSLPDACADTEAAFPGANRLPPEAFGALVSLVYNRGGDTSDNNRRAEMRGIKDSIACGNYGVIPAKIRDMKRLWAGRGLNGLLRRREDEAKLVESALTGTKGNGVYAVMFDRVSRDIKGIPANRPNVEYVQVKPAIPATEADAEELRSFFFHNASVVANSLKERMLSVGNRNICILQVKSTDDMLWVAEFEDLVLRDAKGNRVLEDKKLGKYVKADITDLDFDEYPPSEVAKVLYLTQSLMRTSIPSPLLAQWAPNSPQRDFIVGSGLSE